MANAGQGLPVPAPAANCGPVTVIPGKECEGEVQINGVVIPCNDPDGWQLSSGTELELVGAACDTIMNELEADITASFRCDSIVGPPN